MDLTFHTTESIPEYATAFSRAAALARSVPYDQYGVERLCKRLTGLKDEDPLVMIDRLRSFAMPKGIMHVRLFDAATHEQIAAAVRLGGEPLGAAQIMALVSVTESFNDGNWVRTTALPVRDPGVLDLLLHFQPRP